MILWKPNFASALDLQENSAVPNEERRPKSQTVTLIKARAILSKSCRPAYSYKEEDRVLPDIEALPGVQHTTCKPVPPFSKQTYRCLDFTVIASEVPRRVRRFHLASLRDVDHPPRTSQG